MKSKRSITALYVLLALFLATNAFAQELFEKDSNYDIYYEASAYEGGFVRNVRIIGIIDGGEKKFLEITGSGFGGKEKKGFILFDSIKAMLPSGYIKVHRYLIEGESDKRGAF